MQCNYPTVSIIRISNTQSCSHTSFTHLLRRNWLEDLYPRYKTSYSNNTYHLTKVNGTFSQEESNLKNDASSYIPIYRHERKIGNASVYHYLNSLPERLHLCKTASTQHVALWRVHATTHKFTRRAWVMIPCVRNRYRSYEGKGVATAFHRKTLFWLESCGFRIEAANTSWLQ